MEVVGLGQLVVVTCGDCMTRFSSVTGMLFGGAPTRCRECGREGPLVMIGNEGEDLAPPDTGLDCSCGGRFASDAPHRCPTCKRAFTESDLGLLDDGSGPLLD
jgi:hypothetical protein